MTGKTHRVGGMLCVLGGYTLLESRGMLLADVNPLLQLTVMYPFAIYGSVVSDLDHNWNSAPSRDVVSYFINAILHLSTKLREKSGNSDKKGFSAIFDAKHRSWQTHSDLFLIAMIIISASLLNSNISSADQVIVRLVTLGLTLGIISHLFLDMLTPEGIWCLLAVGVGKVVKFRNMPQKISFVPNSKFFRTGGTWEDMIRYLMWFLCILLFLRILYNLGPYRVNFLQQ